jgi:hypothetical protein
MSEWGRLVCALEILRVQRKKGINRVAWDRLGWCNVEARTPVWFVGKAIEAFFDKLFPPRQSVAPAH